MEIVQDAIHRAVLVIQIDRGYDSVSTKQNGDENVCEQSLESLRPVTGILLSKFYPHTTKEDNQKNNGERNAESVVDEGLIPTERGHCIS